MIRSWSIGDIKVTSLVEYYGPTHVPEATFPAFDAAKLATQAALLPPGHWFADIQRLTIAIQIWIVAAGASRILIDTGVGNGKPRPAQRMNMLNTLVPQWMAAAGVTRENVTHVVMTHLHSDHIGWNTVREGDRWVPTFPNARYLVPKDDFAYFKGLHDSGKAADSSIADSLLPVLDAGLVDFIDKQGEVADVLEISRATGHTPGMLNYWVRSKGETGVFSGDVAHHPVQVLNPDWNTAFCILADEARATRRALLAAAADTGARIMPCHFAPPHCGFVRRQGDGFIFEPTA
jgi:glyoxylase-like metal-dependent hydrolase (beta-lactamase superfamily II)